MNKYFLCGRLKIREVEETSADDIISRVLDIQNLFCGKSYEIEVKRKEYNRAKCF